ncbi:MAG: hypothetical protein Aurels2KO_25450 [Aureliella sp.]
MRPTEKIMSLALLVCVCGGAVAQQITPDPSDSSRPYLSIFTHDDYAQRPAEAQLVQNIQSGALGQLAKSCHFKHYTTSDPMYRDRFARSIPASEFPVVMVERSGQGGYVYKQSGNRIPSTAPEILEEIKFYSRLDPAANDPLQSGAKQQSCGPDGCPPGVPQFPSFQPESQLPDSAELFNKTPVRDSMASMATIVVGLVAAGFVLFLVVLAIVLLYLTRPKV